MKEENAAFPSEWARWQLLRQDREAGVAFVYLDQGQFAYSQEVRLPGQPVMGVAGARGGHPDADSADPRRLPRLHQRPWQGLGEARDRSEEGLHGGSVGRTLPGREAGSGLARMMIPVGSGSRTWAGGRRAVEWPRVPEPLRGGIRSGHNWGQADFRTGCR